MTWQRIDDKHRLRNKGGDLGIRRVYGKEGELWPRIVVCVYDKDVYGEGFAVVASRKENTSAWWKDCLIPLECKNDVYEGPYFFVWDD